MNLKAAVATEFLKSSPLASALGRRDRLFDRACRDGAVHGHPQGSRGSTSARAARSKGSPDRRDRPLADVLVPPWAGRHGRRCNPVRIPDGLGLRARVRRPDDSWHAAIPTPRRTIVLAKEIVVAGVSPAIAIWVLILALVIGAPIGMPDWSTPEAVDATGAIALGARPYDRSARGYGVLRQRRPRLHRSARLDRRNDRRVTGPGRPGLRRMVPLGSARCPGRSRRCRGRATWPRRHRGRPTHCTARASSDRRGGSAQIRPCERFFA